jgi:hypothetical protein
MISTKSRDLFVSSTKHHESLLEGIVLICAPEIFQMLGSRLDQASGNVACCVESTSEETSNHASIYFEKNV